MIATRLIIIEGMMGSGKSTLTVFVSQQLRKNRVKQKRVMEATVHPTNVLMTLPNWRKPWLDVSSDEYMRLCERNWNRFVEDTLQQDCTYIFDGQFLHGDFTVLMMMNTPQPALVEYVDRLQQIIQPLNPVFIYLYQNPVEKALERISNVRGKGWVNHQVRWKTESPYCQTRGYSGRSGWVQMYQDYRVLTDLLYHRLQLPKIAIDISEQNWTEYEAKVLAFLDGSMV